MLQTYCGASPTEMKKMLEQKLMRNIYGLMKISEEISEVASTFVESCFANNEVKCLCEPHKAEADVFTVQIGKSSIFISRKYWTDFYKLLITSIQAETDINIH